MNKLFIAALCVLAALPAAAGSEDHHPVPHIQPNAGWDRLKALVGDWEGKNKEKFSYKLVSAGSAVVESIGMPEGEMVSVYHPDGKNLLMTHYCAIGNQPRMRAKVKGKAETLVFTFVDASNLEGNDAHIMKGLTITFKDDDHIVEEWSSVTKGQKAPEKSVFELTRKK